MWQTSSLAVQAEMIPLMLPGFIVWPQFDFRQVNGMDMHLFRTECPGICPKVLCCTLPLMQALIWKLCPPASRLRACGGGGQGNTATKTQTNHREEKEIPQQMSLIFSRDASPRRGLGKLERHKSRIQICLDEQRNRQVSGRYKLLHSSPKRM